VPLLARDFPLFERLGEQLFVLLLEVAGQKAAGCRQIDGRRRAREIAGLVRQGEDSVA